MICKKCHVLCGDVCPKCGSKRFLKETAPDEPVLLIVLTAMQAMLVEPVILESGRPYYKKGLYGGALAMQAGLMREIFSFYVSYADYKACRSLLEEVFGEDEEIMRSLHEFDWKES